MSHAPGEAKHARGCLFCLRRDRSFRSREHIFPEGLLGQHEKILSPGVVCDGCNNGPLSDVDHALVQFPPVTLLLAERGIGGKAGKAKVSKWGNATLAFTAPRELSVWGHSAQVIVPDGPGRFKLNLRTGGPVPARTYAKIARALYKATIECIYLDRGPDVAFDPKFDEVRAVTLGTLPSRGWLGILAKAIPHNEVRLTYQFVEVAGEETVWIAADIYGLVIVTDLMHRVPRGDPTRVPDGFLNISVWDSRLRVPG